MNFEEKTNRQEKVVDTVESTDCSAEVIQKTDDLEYINLDEEAVETSSIFYNEGESDEISYLSETDDSESKGKSHRISKKNDIVVKVMIFIIIIVGIVCILKACCGNDETEFGIISVPICTQQPAEKPVPTNTPAPISSSTPTSTPQPTSTPIVETTPEPEVTPIPTSTPKVSSNSKPRSTAKPLTNISNPSNDNQSLVETDQTSSTTNGVEDKNDGGNQSGNQPSTPKPTPGPTQAPKPTMEPTPEPTQAPKPTMEPTPKPTQAPKPTMEPTPEPTQAPKPTMEPTPEPTPTPIPTPVPTPTPNPTSPPDDNEDTIFTPGSPTDAPDVIPPFINLDGDINEGELDIEFNDFIFTDSSPESHSE